MPTRDQQRAGALPGSQADLAAVFEVLPFPCMLLDTDLVIRQVSGAYATTMGRARTELVGRYLFDAFPLPPDVEAGDSTDDLTDDAEDGRSHGSAEHAAEDPLLLVRASMQRVLDTGQPDPVPLQKYDVPSSTGPTGFEERWWSFTTFPVLAADGVVSALLHVTEDVTDQVSQRAPDDLDQLTIQLRSRTRQLEADLYARAVQVQTLTAAREQAAARLNALSQVALSLAEADTVEDLTDLLTDRGLAALGCDSGAIALFDLDDAAWMNLTITDGFGAATQRNYSRLPAAGPLPACVAATTGATVLLGDAAASLAFSEHMGAVMESTGSVAFACLPLEVAGRCLGSLTAGWHQVQPFDPDQRQLLAVLAAQGAQALDRILVRAAEREAAAAAAAAWETLQRSLLTDPPEPDHMQVVVRYRPAAHAAQVGGDWYDAFLQREGSTVLVIGDVIGHDSTAAAAMGQVRGTMRAIGVHTGLGPAELLGATDEAMHDLMLPTTATAVVGRVEQTPDERERGVTRIRWSNAGHLPPMVIDSAGQVSALIGVDTDLLLGITADTERHESVAVVDRGATVLLYTDGLVERRGESLEVGLQRLEDTLAEVCRPGQGQDEGLSLDAVVDELLQRLVPAQGDDDVALLAVRLHRQDRPRPDEAGPQVLNGTVAPER